MESLENNPAESTPNVIRQPHAVRYGLDVPLLLSVVTLLVIGLLMVFSASWKYATLEKQPVTFVLFSQITWVVIGGAAALAAGFFDYHRYRRLVVLIMIGTIGMLLAVLIVQDERNGAARSLLGGSIRPSELAKLAIVIYLAFWLYSKREVLNNMSFGLFPLIVIMGVVGGFGRIIWIFDCIDRAHWSCSFGIIPGGFPGSKPGFLPYPALDRRDSQWGFVRGRHWQCGVEIDRFALCLDGQHIRGHCRGIGAGRGNCDRWFVPGVLVARLEDRR
jgi:hypothetical protein